MAPERTFLAEAPPRLRFDPDATMHLASSNSLKCMRFIALSSCTATFLFSLEIRARIGVCEHSHIARAGYQSA